VSVLALGEAEEVGAVLVDADGDAVLTVEHEIAKTIVVTASDFIICRSPDVDCLFGHDQPAISLKMSRLFVGRLRRD
jgi:hypothetical protein